MFCCWYIILFECHFVYDIILIHSIPLHFIHFIYFRACVLLYRFPASDIPLPARQLYIKNGLRYIHNVDGKDVPIHAKEGLDMDLTQCRMRAIAKPHIVYLRNMGVTCSMSLALVVENELWGLLAFHGYGKPFKPSLHQRIACETVASMVSVRLEAVVKKAQSTRVIALGSIMLSLKQEQSPLHNLHDWGEGLLEIFDADVIVANVSDQSDGEGDSVVLGDKSLVPTKTFWTKMKFSPNRELISMSTRAAIDARRLTKEECPPCGVVYFEENRTQVMIGRKERSREVIWAGNPDEPKLKIGGILCPRSSFDQFMEKVSC